MADIERLDRALAHIEVHPEQHNQHVWMRPGNTEGRVDCGTAACLAGWVIAQEYPDAVFVMDGWDRMSPGSMASNFRTGDDSPDRQRRIEDSATELLGLTPGQATVLFSAGNTIVELKNMRNLLAADPAASVSALSDLQPIDDEWDGGDECEYEDEE